jgi:hypothetical protein
MIFVHCGFFLFGPSCVEHLPSYMAQRGPQIEMTYQKLLEISPPHDRAPHGHLNDLLI